MLGRFLPNRSTPNTTKTTISIGPRPKMANNVCMASSQLSVWLDGLAGPCCQYTSKSARRGRVGGLYISIGARRATEQGTTRYKNVRKSGVSPISGPLTRRGSSLGRLELHASRHLSGADGRRHHVELAP